MRVIVGSLVSVGAGWLAGVLLLAVPIAYGVAVGGADAGHPSIFLHVAISILTGLVLLTWLIVFLPIYLFMPTRSPLWRWHIATPLGFVAGVVILAVVWNLIESSNPGGYFSLRAGIIGAVTCLTASLTRDRFVRTET